MLNQNVPQKQSCLNPIAEKRECLERREAQAEIREAIHCKSASAFVVSRLEWRLSLGLNTSGEVL